MANLRDTAGREIFEQAVTLRQLRFLRAVVTCGGFSAAAQKLLVAQSTVSYEIARLESLAGTPLISRQGRRLQLTAEGEIVYRYALRILDTVDEVADVVNELRGLERGRLSVGADSNYGTYVLPRVLKQFSEEYPGIELHVEIRNSTVLLEAVRDGSLELVIVPDIHEGLRHATDLTGEPFEDFSFVVIAPPDHPLASRAVVELGDLAGLKFVAREPTSWPREMFDDLAAKIEPRPVVAFEFTSSEAVKQAVMAGLGLALIATQGISREVARGELAVLNLKGYPIAGQYCLVQRATQRLTFSGRAFRRFLLEGAKATTRVGGRAGRGGPSPEF